MFKEKLPTLSIRLVWATSLWLVWATSRLSIEIDKLRQTNFNEFLDEFDMKKARTKTFFECLLCSVQSYLIR